MRSAVVPSRDPDDAALPTLQRVGGVEDQVEQGVLQVPLDTCRGGQRGSGGELEAAAVPARVVQLGHEGERTLGPRSVRCPPVRMGGSPGRADRASGRGARTIPGGSPRCRCPDR